MSRVLSAAFALMLFAASSAAQSAAMPSPPTDDHMGKALARLDRSQYGEALVDFEKALDAYATAQRFDDVRRAYMQLFVGNRNYAGVLMNAMKAWVEKHRRASAGQPSASFAAFDAWVQERHALAAATVNLAHNSPDWK